MIRDMAHCARLFKSVFVEQILIIKHVFIYRSQHQTNTMQVESPYHSIS